MKDMDMAIKIAKQVSRYNGRTFLVGGCVRDEILGKKIKDIDIEIHNIEVEKLLDSVNITCNKNTVPNDPKSPFVTSGIRLGTPAITSRGVVESDMIIIADAINITLHPGIYS